MTCRVMQRVGSVPVAIMVVVGVAAQAGADSGMEMVIHPTSTVPEIVVTALRMTQDVHSVPYTAYRLGAQAA